MADREADIMALMVRARDLGTPLDWLLRSQHNRTLNEGDELFLTDRESRIVGVTPVIESRDAMDVPGVRWREINKYL